MTTTISLLTDFGPGSVYVGEMHAVLRRLAPDAGIVDLAHDIPVGGVEAAAYVLGRSWRHGPEGTVHVVVVDPGVGTSRAILAARAGGHLFVGPDNGVLADVVGDGEVRRVENRARMAETISSTFHGRDIMAPVAAGLATGGPLEEVGPPVRPCSTPSRLSRGSGGITGCILMADRYGNLITNVGRSLVEELGGSDGAVSVRIGSESIQGLVTTFGDVAPGRLLAYVGSGDHLEIGVNGGSAADRLCLGPDAAIRVEGSSR